MGQRMGAEVDEGTGDASHIFRSHRSLRGGGCARLAPQLCHRPFDLGGLSRDELALKLVIGPLPRRPRCRVRPPSSVVATPLTERNLLAVERKGGSIVAKHDLLELIPPEGAGFLDSVDSQKEGRSGPKALQHRGRDLRIAAVAIVKGQSDRVVRQGPFQLPRGEFGEREDFAIANHPRELLGEPSGGDSRPPRIEGFFSDPVIHEDNRARGALREAMQPPCRAADAALDA